MNIFIYVYSLEYEKCTACKYICSHAFIFRNSILSLFHNDPFACPNKRFKGAREFSELAIIIEELRF